MREAQQNILADIPDVGDWSTFRRWFDELPPVSEAGALDSISGADLDLPDDPCGRFGVERFRRFLGAVLAADWITYELPDDRANILRLGFVLDRFPQGFRAWFTHGVGGWRPVGYSAWYPIDAATHRRLWTNDPPWRDRAIVPLTAYTLGDHLYLFNYSILPVYRKGDGARRLLTTLAEEVLAVRPAGMAAITVSADGARVAGRFGLLPRHEIQVGASTEQIWVSGA